jgi:putative phosphoribosyl transferase
VGEWYTRFSPTLDDEVVTLLDANNDGVARAYEHGPGDHPIRTRRDDEIAIDAGGVRLAGHLTVPAGATGVVVFAHGSGSSRHSPRNRLVADELNASGLATLLFDLLTPTEAFDRANTFNIELLARRLRTVTQWVHRRPDLAALGIGYFGASTGAAAALRAAADEPSVRAVVSRGGRPDLAAPRLAEVHAPTLLIVGSRDAQVRDLNRRAADELSCPHTIEIVPGATHLFEEPGTLEAASRLARDWFVYHLAPARSLRVGGDDGRG